MKKIYALAIALFVVNGAISQSIQPCVPCLPQGIYFWDQNEINNFPLYYPNCTEILGLVVIHGNNITNLNGLCDLTSFGSNLDIGDNNLLTSLTGLHNVTSIGGTLTIAGNPVLASLTGLDSVTSIGGDLLIQDNNSLTSLTGLDSVTSIYGSTSISGNNSLTSLTGLHNVTSIGGALGIFNNDSLTSLTGMNSLVSIGGEFRLGGLTSGQYVDYTNLTSLSGLENLTSIGGGFFIGNNWNLTNFSGLENLTSIGDYLRIGICPSLYNSGASNPSLTSLTGLENVTFIWGSLWIENNDLLSNCAVQSICQYLASPNGQIEIWENAEGCNSVEEVEDSCASVGIKDLNPLSTITIYPNPASNTLTIETLSPSQLSILNLNGQPLITRQVTEPKTVVDISTLPSGVYVVKAVGEKGVQVEKVIKK